MAKNYLKESRTYQDLLNTAKKYNIAEYVPGQSFDAHKEKMSAEDYEKSQKLLEYYTSQQNLTNDYDYNTEQIESNRKKQLQENAVSKEMTMRYLPEYLKMQGLGGLGVSESSVIEANNNFMNARNSINADIESQKAELLKNYKENMRTLDTGATNDVTTIREKYEIARKEEATNLYNSFVDKINYGEFNTSDELEQSYNQIKDKLYESQKAVIEDKINYFKNSVAQQEIDNEYREQTQKEQVAQEKNIIKEQELIANKNWDYDASRTPVFESEQDKAKYLENYELFAKGDTGTLAKNNKDDIVAFMSKTFGGDPSVWNFWAVDGRLINLQVSEGQHGVDIDKLTKFAAQYGLEVDVANRGSRAQDIFVRFTNKMKAQDMAKALAAFSGKSFK